jgi:hypothetical protein
MKTKSLIFVNRFNKIIWIKILHKKQYVNYDFQKYLFMMLYVVEQQNISNHTYYKLNDKIASCNICKFLDFNLHIAFYVISLFKFRSLFKLV